MKNASRILLLCFIGVCIGLLDSIVSIIVGNGYIDQLGCGSPDAFAPGFFQNCLLQQDRLMAEYHNGEIVGLLIVWVGVAAIICAYYFFLMPRYKNSSADLLKTATHYGFVIAAIGLLLFVITSINSQNSNEQEALVLMSIELVGGFAGLGAIIMLPIKTQKPKQVSSITRHLTSREEEKYIEALQTAQDSPQSLEALTNLGHIQHELGRDNEALITANKALNLALILNQDYAPAWLLKCVALCEMEEREEEALAACNQALAIDPGSIDALFYKGKVLALQEKDNEAEAVFNEVLRRDPDYLDAYAEKYALYIIQERYQEALALAKYLVSKKPNGADIYRLLGMAYSLLGGRLQSEEYLNDAERAYDKALQIDPSFAEIWALKSAIFASKGDYGKALDAVIRALQIDPHNAKALEVKAEILKARAKSIAATGGLVVLRLVVGIVRGIVEAFIFILKSAFK